MVLAVYKWFSCKLLTVEINTTAENQSPDPEDARWIPEINQMINIVWMISNYFMKQMK